MSAITDILDAILIKAFKEGELRVHYPERRNVISAKFKLYARKHQIRARQEKFGDIPELFEASEAISLTTDPSEPEVLILFNGSNATDVQELAKLLDKSVADEIDIGDQSKLSESEAALKRLLDATLEQDSAAVESKSDINAYYTRD